MNEDNRVQSRRSVLKAAAGLGGAAVTTALAGCSDVQSTIGVGGGESTNGVPEDAESVYTIDVGAIVEDDAVVTLTDAYLEMRAESEWYSGPEDYDEALDQFEDETGLEATMAGRITAFSEYSDYGVASEYAGTIFTGEWEQDDVVDAYEDEYDADEDEYEGKTFFEPDEEYQPAMAILGDNRYVIGQSDAVEDVVDATIGEDDEYTAEVIKDEVDELKIEQDGSDVVITYEKPVSEIEDAIDEQSESTRA